MHLGKSNYFYKRNLLISILSESKKGKEYMCVVDLCDNICPYLMPYGKKLYSPTSG